MVPCQYCNLELAFTQAGDHEDYCGTRTEPCPVCKCNVMLRERDIHPALCGSLTPPQERSSSTWAAEPQSPGAWFEAHSIHNLLRAQERLHNNNNVGGATDCRAPPRPIEGRLHNSTRGTVGMRTRRNTAPRNNEFSRCELRCEQRMVTLPVNHIQYHSNILHIPLLFYFIFFKKRS